MIETIMIMTVMEMAMDDNHSVIAQKMAASEVIICALMKGFTLET